MGSPVVVVRQASGGPFLRRVLAIVEQTKRTPLEIPPTTISED